MSNLIVDTVWSLVFQPLLPNGYDFILPTGLQNILNDVLNPSLVTNWSDVMQAILSPYSNGLPNIQQIINSPNSIISSGQSEFWIFDVLTQLGGYH